MHVHGSLAVVFGQLRWGRLPCKHRRSVCACVAASCASVVLHRFDKFNLKYNPFGQSRLREIFIKQVSTAQYVVSFPRLWTQQVRP